MRGDDMMNLILSLDIVLAIVTIVVLVKELLIKYNFSKKVFKNFIFIFCGIATVIILNASFIYGYSAQQHKASIELSIQKANPNVLYDGVTEEQRLKQQLVSVNKEIAQVKIATLIAVPFLE
jgi:glucan phosphoethanolaminetransferase (alkaline phosphatase superfamily)